jgi:hypothetical protein
MSAHYMPQRIHRLKERKALQRTDFYEIIYVAVYGSGAKFNVPVKTFTVQDELVLYSAVLY